MEDRNVWSHWIGPHANHYPLPPSLEVDLRGVDLAREPLRPLGPASAAVILTAALARAEDSVRPFGPPVYHNGKHFRETVAHAGRLMDACEEPVPDAVREAEAFAAANHDIGHSGSTFRKDALHGVVRPDLGVGIATEEVSAILADEDAREAGFSVGARLFICRGIHASTFGNPAIVPKSPMERLLCCADVSPDDTFADWLRKGVDVTFREVPAKPAPTTLLDWYANRIGFIDYYLMDFVTPGRPRYVPAAVRLGYDRMLAGHRAKLVAARDGTDEGLAALVRSMLPDSVDLGA